MNTKGTKFLAVLAVLAMAFAGVAVIADLESSDAASVTADRAISGNYTIGEEGAADFASVTDKTKDFYVNASTAFAITLAEDMGGVEGATYNFYIYQAADTNAITFTGVDMSRMDADSLTVNIYTATKAISDGKVDYDNKSYFSFNVTKTNLASATAKIKASYVSSNANLYATEAPGFGTNVYQTAASKFLPAMGSDITLTSTYAFTQTANAAPYTGKVSDGTNSVYMTAAVAEAGFTLTKGDAFTHVSNFTDECGKLAVTAGTITYTQSAGNDAVVTGVKIASDATIVYPTLAKAQEAGATAALFVIGQFDLNTNFTSKYGITVVAGAVMNVLEKYTLTFQQTMPDTFVGTEATLGLISFNIGGVVNVAGKVIGKAGTYKAPTHDPAYPTTYDGKWYPLFNLTETESELNLYNGSQFKDMRLVTNSGTIQDYSADENAKTITGIINENLTLTSDTYLDGSTEAVIIDAGKTVTASAQLILSGELIVKGTLVIESSGAIGSAYSSTAADYAEITITSTGKITNNGVIGKNFPIVYTADGDQSITMLGLSGLSVGYSSAGPTLSGTGAIVSGAFTWFESSGVFYVPSNAYALIDGATIKTASIPAGAELDATVADFTSNVTEDLSVSGEFIPCSKVLLKAGGSVAVPGKMTGEFSVVTLEDTTNKSYAEAGISIDAGTAVGGFKVSSVKEDNLDSEKNTYYNYRAYISGTLATSETADTFAYTPETEGAMLFVSETLTVPSTITMSGQVLNVTGKVTSGKNLEDAVLVGGTWAVTGTETTYYAASVLEALEEIDKADSKTITLYGIRDSANKNEKYYSAMTGDVTIAGDQKIKAVGDKGALQIASGTILTVSS